MNSHTITPAEIGLIRWYRDLPTPIKNAIHLWLLTGDSSLIAYEFSRHHQAAA